MLPNFSSKLSACNMLYYGIFARCYLKFLFALLVSYIEKKLNKKVQPSSSWCNSIWFNHACSFVKRRKQFLKKKQCHEMMTFHLLPPWKLLLYKPTVLTTYYIQCIQRMSQCMVSRSLNSALYKTFVRQTNQNGPQQIEFCLCRETNEDNPNWRDEADTEGLTFIK